MRGMVLSAWCLVLSGVNVYRFDGHFYFFCQFSTVGVEIYHEINTNS